MNTMLEAFKKAGLVDKDKAKILEEEKKKQLENVSQQQPKPEATSLNNGKPGL